MSYSHYETLGVERTATQEEIKKSYRILAGKNHPDKPGGNTQKFQEIQSAYEVLSDERKKAQYDMELSGGGGHQFRFHTSGLGPQDVEMSGDMFDLLRRQFGVGFGPGGRFNQGYQPPQRNQDVRVLIQLDIVDTLDEHTKILNVTLPSGQKENIEIKIPRGIHDGETVKYPGLGSWAIPNIPRGDLYVQFHVRKHADFEQSGVDLYRSLTVNCFEAIVGCKKEVAGLDGKLFNLTVPPGTQYGANFGIPDSGLYIPGSSTRGRLIIVIEIYIPKLNDKQIEIIKNLQTSIPI